MTSTGATWHSFFLAAAAALSTTNAYSMTGAEFLQANPTFGVGYAFGVMEYRIGVINDDDEQFFTIRECVISSKINSKTLYDATVARLNRTPSELALPAFGAVINVLAEMCVK